MQADDTLLLCFFVSLQPYHPFDFVVTGGSLLYLVLTCVVYFGVAMLVDFLLSFPSIRAKVRLPPLTGAVGHCDLHLLLLLAAEQGRGQGHARIHGGSGRGGRGRASGIRQRC